MKMIKKTSVFISLFSVAFVFGQSNELTSSPYSLFGLGAQTNSSIGKFNGLGKTGVASRSTTFINNANPASFANFGRNLFLLDIGLSAEFSNLSDNESSSQQSTANLSNLALAFPLIDKSGLGISLTRASSVGYSLTGIEGFIENTTELTTTDVTGEGGINDLSFDFGYQLTPRLSLGFNFSYMWGEIEEEEVLTYGNEGLTLEEVNLYNGTQFGLGFQFCVSKKLTLGYTIDFETSLKGTKTQFVSQTFSDATTTVSYGEEIAISSFDLPLSTGLGINYNPNESLFLNADYHQSFWDSTNQEDSIGSFVDQHIFAISAEYIPESNGLKYWKKINYRAGVNYDSGYLEINDNKIDNLSGSLGLGLPLGRRGGMLNFSYVRGIRGVEDGVLVEENLNQFNVSLNLLDLWFKKKKYN